MKKWHERVTEARIRSGMSQADLARELKISDASISQWESGEIKHLRAENLLRLAVALGVDPGWLLHGKSLGLTVVQTPPHGAEAHGTALLAMLPKLSEEQRHQLLCAAQAMAMCQDLRRTDGYAAGMVN